MSDNKSTGEHQPSESNRSSKTIGSSSSSIVALLIQKNVDKGRQLSISSIEVKSKEPAKK